MRKAKLLLTLIIILYLNEIKGQEQQITSEGGFPSSIKWKFLENSRVKVVFPEGSEAQATRIANTIDYIGKNATGSVGSKYKKLDLLLNTNTVISNGYVALSPFRSQFNAIGFQSSNYLGTTDWLDNLSIHEYRHALQFKNARQGRTSLFNFLMGENGWRYITNITIPMWYFEGDAVLTETLLTNAGRGRTPAFFELQRAILLNDVDYSYSQSRNDSYDKLIPNYYVVGYNIINYGRNHYGDKLWRNVLADAGKGKHVFYSFSQSLKDRTKHTAGEMYKLSLEELKTKWNNELKEITLTVTEPIIQVLTKTITDYLFPHISTDGSIICIKKSFNELPKLCKIKDGKEEILTSIGITNEDFLSVSNNLVTWTELRKDPRYSERTLNVLITYDLNKGEKKRITQKTKLFSPSFSKNGNKLVAVQAHENLKNRVVILSQDGKSILDSIPNQKNDFVSYPRWVDENTIVYLANRKSKIAMIKYDLSDKKETTLTPWSSHTIGNFTIHNDTAVFDSSYSGINNIYEVPLDGSQNIVQLSSVKIGATNPAVSDDGKTIIMTELTPMGRHIIGLKIGQGNKTPVPIVEPVQMDRFNVFTTTEEQDILDKIPNEKYKVKDYRGLFRGMKLHSWGANIGRDNGLGIEIRNILNDFTATAGGFLSYNEKTFRYGAGFEYSRFFLPFSASLNNGERTVKVLSQNRIGVDAREFEQRDANFGLRLPLSWIRGNYTIGLGLNANFSNIAIKPHKSEIIYDNASLNLNVIRFGVHFTNYRARAIQNVNYKWSQWLNVNYEKSISSVIAERISGDVGFTFPGFLKNHAVEFNFRIKKEFMKNLYQFEDNFLHARGYSVEPGDKEIVFSANYGLPLFNVDRGVGGIFFLNRIRGNAFFDAGNVNRDLLGTNLNQRSAGAELIFDSKLLNVINFGWGFRNSILLDKNYTYKPEIFLALNF